MENDEARLEDFRQGQRVQIHPANDRWMQGDRYGVITQVSKAQSLIRVRLDRSGDSLWFEPRNLLKGVP